MKYTTKYLKNYRPLNVGDIVISKYYNAYFTPHNRSRPTFRREDIIFSEPLIENDLNEKLARFNIDLEVKTVVLSKCFPISLYVIQKDYEVNEEIFIYESFKFTEYYGYDFKKIPYKVNSKNENHLSASNERGSSISAHPHIGFMIKCLVTNLSIKEGIQFDDLESIDHIPFPICFYV
jgi:hypothetical protein